MKNLFFHLIISICLSSVNSFLTPFRVLPPGPALLSGVLSGPSAAKYGPFKLASGDYMLFAEWITPGIWQKSGIALVSADPSWTFADAITEQRVLDAPFAYVQFGTSLWVAFTCALHVPERHPGDTDADREYMILLGDEIRVAAGRMVGTPTAAEVRFWLFDTAHFPGVSAGPEYWRWVHAAQYGAVEARQSMQLPAALGTPPGIDVLLAAGMARLP